MKAYPTNAISYKDWTMRNIYILILAASLNNLNLNAQSKVDEVHYEDKETTQFSQVIKKGKADQVKLLVSVSGGELNIAKTQNNLAKIDFIYNKPDWTPSASYIEDEKGGKLQVKANINDTDRINKKNSCNVLINPNNTYSLGVILGAGVANLDFSDFTIEKALFRMGVGTFNINLANTSIPLLKIEAGIGEATLDLSGKWKNNLSAEIKAGVGEIKIIVPKNEGCRFIISGFLGDIKASGFDQENKSYTNAAYDTSENKLEFKINGAIGSITIIEK